MGLGWVGARRADRAAMESIALQLPRTGDWNAVLALETSLAMADGRLDEAEALIDDARAFVDPDAPITALFVYQSGVLDHLRGRHDDTPGVPTTRFSRFVNPPWEVARRSARDGDWQTAKDRSRR